MSTDKADRLLDLDVFIRAQIIDFNSMLCLCRRLLGHYMQHRREAVSHVKIGFPLSAVPQHLQVPRMFKQLFVEIQHVTVRISFAEDRNEPKDVTLEAKPLAISLNQNFTRDLGSGVQGGLDRERMVLWRRDLARFA